MIIHGNLIKYSDIPIMFTGIITLTSLISATSRNVSNVYYFRETYETITLNVRLGIVVNVSKSTPLQTSEVAVGTHT